MGYGLWIRRVYKPGADCRDYGLVLRPVGFDVYSLQSENFAAVLKPEHLKQALDEAELLKPHLEVLNFGKGSEKEATTGTLSQLKRRKITAAAAAPSQEAVKAAADAVHTWLQKDMSPLRAMLSILAGSGAIWSAHVAEKVARAAVLHKPIEAPKMRPGIGTQEGADCQRQLWCNGCRGRQGHLVLKHAGPHRDF